MDTDLSANAIASGHAFISALQINCANQRIFTIRIIATLGLVGELAYIRRGLFPILIDLSRFDAKLWRRTVL
jgi:hypothetical protein